MRRNLGTLSMAALPVFLSLAVAGDSEGSKSAVEAITLGEHWYGPDLKPSDLKGRVVLVEFWGLK